MSKLKTIINGISRIFDQVALGGAENSDGKEVGIVVISDVVVPSREYLEWTGTASAVVATAAYTSPDVSGYNTHTFEAITNTAKVKASVDGTTNWADVQVLVNGVLSATIAAGSIGVLEGKFKAVALHPNAAVSTNGRGAHGNQ